MGRYSIVLSLLLLTGLIRVVVQPAPDWPLTLPAIGQLRAGSDWQVEATEVSRWGMIYRQWTLRTRRGQVAFLYLAATNKVQTLVHWSGELGFEGEGYLVLGRRVQTVKLPDGAAATVSVVRIRRMNEQRVLAYAVVSPDGIAAHGTDNLLHTAWDVIRGTAGRYYLVRVAVPTGAQKDSGEAIALQLIAKILPEVQRHLSASTQ